MTECPHDVSVYRFEDTHRIPKLRLTCSCCHRVVRFWAGRDAVKHIAAVKMAALSEEHWSDDV